MEMLQGEFLCGNPKCKNKFKWIGFSTWNETKPFVTPVIKIEDNMCSAKEHAEPRNGIYFFTLVCPKCGRIERVGFDPENDSYLGHEEQD